MNVIKKIPYWEDSYPAFLLCEQLNTNGVTGWYLPAINEVKLNFSYPDDHIWSSTEYSTNNAYFRWRGNNSNYSKTGTYSVMAVHKF